MVQEHLACSTIWRPLASPTSLNRCNSLSSVQICTTNRVNTCVITISSHVIWAIWRLQGSMRNRPTLIVLKNRRQANCRAYLVQIWLIQLSIRKITLWLSTWTKICWFWQMEMTAPGSSKLMMLSRNQPNGWSYSMKRCQMTTSMQTYTCGSEKSLVTRTMIWCKWATWLLTWTSLATTIWSSNSLFLMSIWNGRRYALISSPIRDLRRPQRSGNLQCRKCCA